MVHWYHGTMSTQAINIRFPDETYEWLRKEAFDTRESINSIVVAAVEERRTQALPYTVTVRDIATGKREVDSRHASLGAAVEAMRDVEDLDGMPSYQARVEHDGRPVDTEAVED
jgi:hypothetical protein